MSINRYPAITGTAVTYPGSGTNQYPSVTVPASLYQISSDVDYVINNIRYDKDNTRYQNLSSNTSLYLYIFPDATYYTWTTRLVALTSTQTSVYGNNVFLYGTGTGVIYWSTNGTSWTTRNSSIGATSINSLAYGNGLYLLVGNGNRLATSTDGITWTSRTSAQSSTTLWRLAGAGGGIFMAMANNLLSTSTDGITWTTRTFAFSPNEDTYAYGANFHITGQGGGVIGSTDGITWSTRLTLAQGAQSVGFLNNIFVVGTGAAAGSPGQIYTSTDGITWTLRFTATVDAGFRTRPMYTGSLYIMPFEGATASFRNAYAVSTDGISWVQSKGTGNLNGTNTTTYFTNNGNTIVSYSSGAIGTIEKNNVTASVLLANVGVVYSTENAV